MRLTLYYLPHSPWSNLVRCVAAYHNIGLEQVEYQPIIGEPALRMRLLAYNKQWPRRVTVPVLLTPTGIQTDSWSIVRFLDPQGTNRPLLPAEHSTAIRSWREQSELILNAGRARFMVRAVANETALRELVPPALNRLPSAMLQRSIAVFQAKYGIRSEDYDTHEQTLRDALRNLQAALPKQSDYLLGPLTYADVCMATALQTIAPLPGSGFGPASESVAGEHDLAQEFPDLLRYRDTVNHACPLVPPDTPPAVT